MAVHRVSVNRLQKLAHKKQIIIFGAGNNCNHLFEAIKDLKIEKRIKYILDNDRKKSGTKKVINQKELFIFHPDKLKEENMKDTILLITVVNYQSVIDQLQSLLKNVQDVYCVIYPSYRYWYDKMADWITKKMPLLRMIMLQGEGDTYENAKALMDAYKEYSKGMSGYKIVWVCDHPKRFNESFAEKYVLRDLPLKKHSFFASIRYYSCINRTRYILYENKMIEKRRKGQISCYMNHGIPLKATKGKIQVYADTDYVLSPSNNINSIICEQFGAREEQLAICGSPRTDIFFKEEKESVLTQYLKVEKYSKVILWAPTFRTYEGFTRVDSEMEYKFGIPLIQSKEEYEQLIHMLKKKKILLLIKPHIHQELSKLLLQEDDNLRIIKQDELESIHKNVYDLMRISDALITDYSSIGFDFMLLDRKIGYTIDDIERYTLGFSVSNPLDYMPGNKMRHMSDLLTFIEQVAENIDLYHKEREKLREFLFDDLSGGYGPKLLRILGLL